MIIGPTIFHHYSPEDRTRSSKVVIIRQLGDPFGDCYSEVEVIYDKVRRLLTTVETWQEYALDEDVKEQTVQALYFSISKTLSIASDKVEELITTYQVTNRADVNTIRDVVVQLQELAADLFKPYMM